MTLRETLTWLRSPENLERGASVIPTDYGENPWMIGGCLTWAVAAQRLLGRKARIYTLVRSGEEVGHAVVRYGRHFYDVERSYPNARAVIDAINLAGDVRLELRDTFLRKHPDGEGLVLHEDLLVDLDPYVR